MTTQTELLAALDRALGALWANGVLNDFLDREAINTLTALREQIAKGPAVYYNRHNGVFSAKYFDFFDSEYQPLYALTGDPK